MQCHEGHESVQCVVLPQLMKTIALAVMCTVQASSAGWARWPMLTCECVNISRAEILLVLPIIFLPTNNISALEIFTHSQVNNYIQMPCFQWLDSVFQHIAVAVDIIMAPAEL